ncbi:putative periodic tryptophan protein 2-like protein [Sesbania bispinosa]|nr:putative periodic tryptophan protein 2-like protein [Sesbania bispinosa]
MSIEERGQLQTTVLFDEVEFDSGKGSVAVGHIWNGMGLADASSNVCSQEKMMNCDASSVRLELESIRDCSGVVSDGCILPTEQVPQELVLLGREATSEAQVLFDELKGCLKINKMQVFKGRCFIQIKSSEIEKVVSL